MTYLSGLDDLIGLKKQYPQYEMILHSDQGAVYASKAFNELLPMYSITRLCQELEPQRTMRQWNPSMGGSSQKSLWIFMSQEKAPLNKRWQHISPFLILHGLHTP